MVSCCAGKEDVPMKLSPEEAWAGTLESMVDNRVVFYLKRYNRDYQDYSRQLSASRSSCIWKMGQGIV